MKNILGIFMTLVCSSLCYAQVANIENLKISNNATVSISFKGNSNECVGQTGPHMINEIPQKDFEKLCKEKNCSVKIYPNYSCYGSEEYSFDFNLSFGVGAFRGNSPIYIKAEGFQNNIFVVNKN